MTAALPLLLASLSSAAPAPRLPASALPVPIVRQAAPYSCGAAALLAALQYWNVYDGGEAALYPIIGTTEENGTPPDRIVAGAAHFGLTAYLAENLTVEDLSWALERGDTVVLDFQAWRAEGSTKPWTAEWEDGHYAVLVGLDEHHAYFMDPSSPAAYAYIPLPELADRWHDYEDRLGLVWRTRRLGVFIRGRKPLRRYPGELVRML
jgi:predicted double-glycine peptidase